MSLRQKLLLMISLTVVLVVAIVSWTVSARVRSLFETIDRDRTNLLVDQFLREYQRRSADVSQRLVRLAKDERVERMAYDLAHDGDPATYLTQAATLAPEYQFDYLELLQADGSIVSSAQWPAHFGYREPAIANAGLPTFLKQEQLAPESSAQPGADNTETGLFAVRTLDLSDPPLTAVAGLRLDSAFLANLSTPAGSTVYLYRNAASAYQPANLIDAGGPASDASRFRSLLESTRTSRARSTARIDDLDATAVPLKSLDGNVLAILLVTSSRRELLDAQQHIRAIAYGTAGLGILLAILTSLWIAARVSRPVEQLARATRDLATGNWDVQVPVTSSDEIGELAEAFNRMTRDLLHQRERLVQTERVAAWRELARRLAHELKNPLFPLQLTVENMIRARKLSPDLFDEVFHEGATALTEEIANLKAIIGQFSDFSRMPKPQTAELDLRDVLQRIVRFYRPTLELRDHPIRLVTDISADPLPACIDAELMHRALSNLVLNAMDAMPDGGILTLAASRDATAIRMSIADTGTGMTPEECERLFTPYYTTREAGTGLGLAIVQSVIADHHGSIAVESHPGCGTTFIIDLPTSIAVKDARA